MYLEAEPIQCSQLYIGGQEAQQPWRNLNFSRPIFGGFWTKEKKMGARASRQQLWSTGVNGGAVAMELAASRSLGDLSFGSSCLSFAYREKKRGLDKM
ncbi:hypothetical protein V6N12_068503 [Hibiscus sabdariffa]|uniref:Uncharacterized protein n=1 Tax=Hibiscus sabdariffa TaxID=183260 RepID=A0ABR2FQW8_9ROSI